MRKREEKDAQRGKNAFWGWEVSHEQKLDTAMQGSLVVQRMWRTDLSRDIARGEGRGNVAP
jgi:hypothetical protein